MFLSSLMSIHNALPEMENRLPFTHHQSPQPEAARLPQFENVCPSIHPSELFLTSAWTFLFCFSSNSCFFSSPSVFALVQRRDSRVECGIRMREMLCVDNARTATQATHSLFTPLAGTPDELLAALLLASSLPGLKDYVQIIGCSTNSKGNI